jgi:hypothetical protein
MTESACLHIQDRESGPIRVVELPWISVRIGRATHSEVRLSGPDLPDEICRLQRRGLSWRLLPASSDYPILVNGQRLGGVCILPFNVPFRAGPYCFTLRQDKSAEPDWQMYAGPAPHREDTIEKPPLAEVEPDPLPAPVPQSTPLITATSHRVAEPLIAHTATLRRIKLEPPVTAKSPEPKPYSSTPPACREQWQTRWKTLSAQVSARADNRLKGPELSRPVYRSDLEPIPLREARAPLVEVPANPNPVQELEPERIACQLTVPPQISPAESADLEQQLPELPAELPVEAPPAPSAPTIDPPVLAETPSLLAHDAIAPTVDPPDPVNTRPALAHVVAAPAAEPHPGDEPFILGEQPVSIPSAPLVQDDPGYEAPPRDVAPSPVKNREWPSAKDILAVHRVAPARQVAANPSKTATKKINGSTLMPTLEREPSCWTPPIALAGPVALVFMLAAGLLGCTLSWSWAQDSFAAAIVTDRLLTRDPAIQRMPLPSSVQPPETWLTSTPAHLANWAIFLGNLQADENQSSGETVALLDRALAASPINSQARLARAQLEPVDSVKSVPLRSLGLSRDAISLAWSARRLLAAGKKDDALALFGRALSFAVPDRSSRHRVPRFSEDPAVPRYLLPGEETVREIVAEFVFQNVWTFEEWSRVLPESPIVLIATVRLLRERGRSEAESVLDRMLKSTALPLSPGEAGPVTLAACAEALALRSRFKESDQIYRQAINLIDDPTVRRSWWFNLADIAYRSDDDVQRQAALRLASAVAFSDDITRRATDIQRTTLTRSTGVKAN